MSCIKTAGIPYRGPTIQSNCVNGTTLDLTLAIWDRIGIRTFTADEIEDLLGSPSQLRDLSWISLIATVEGVSLLEAKKRAKTIHNLSNKALRKQAEVIGFSTDSIHLSRYYSYDQPEKMGEWAMDFQGEGIYLYTDIYSVWNKSNEKHVFRGMIQEKDEKGNKKFIVLKDLLKRMGKKQKLKYTVSRPVHLGECLTNSNYTLSDVNIWQDTPKTFNINGDRKRLWETEFSSAWESMEENHSSEPLTVEM